MARTVAKKSTGKKRAAGPFEDILKVARVLSSSTVPERVIETVLTHLCERLGKRARCALLEGSDLRLRFWAGEHSCPVGGLKINKNSIVWDVVKKGKPVNLTDARQADHFIHTLAAPINIKSIIPLSYLDPVTNQEKRLGALIVDSGNERVPVSREDFEYLQVIGELISAVAGRVELTRELLQSWRRQEEILMETAHYFRNSIAVIGGFSSRMAKLTTDKELVEKAVHLHEEVKVLEEHLARFERYMSIRSPGSGRRKELKFLEVD
ncbi:MAG: hypothetical protein A4E57_02991 [Syntrophorhabdaceae bacterium PtaU1.Bin034]|jgi:GAF domain-containing protein|nr:MAG: hypothetical protein A4E57_02991 [Syntrophorhabdaceae bacterium PtaU1.Bin034]